MYLSAYLCVCVGVVVYMLVCSQKPEEGSDAWRWSQRRMWSSGLLSDARVRVLMTADSAVCVVNTGSLQPQHPILFEGGNSVM